MDNKIESINDLFKGLDEIDFVEVKEATSLPETAASSGLMISNGCSTCGSSSCCSS